ncbi:MAG: glycosyltransferase family 39 protein [Planctomycetota bacterium]|nr:glycosyltransferase family 39 protein [Planctomycetota bacterium]
MAAISENAGGHEPVREMAMDRHKVATWERQGRKALGLIEGNCEERRETVPHAAPDRRPPGRKATVAAIISLLLSHAGLLAWMGYRDSPTWDEVGHFAAGLTHWQMGAFHQYTVNPPLVRSVACAPVALLMHPVLDYGLYGYIADSQIRTEFLVGRRLAQANGMRYYWLLTVARWTAIPFSLLGAWICFLWARDLYGECAGIVAMTLWVFSPNILGHGHLISPDVGGAATGVLAAYVFWKWLRKPTWACAAGAGLALGVAELAKATWIILFVLWPIAWVMHRWMQRHDEEPRNWRGEGVQVAGILVIGLWLLNVGYGFEGSFKQLGDYQFISRSLGGWSEKVRQGVAVRNRFAGSWMGKIPIPLPENYVRGIDVQRGDFERQTWSYLRGEWRQRGWWYFYLYAMLVKEPVGTWVLVVMAIGVGLLGRGYSGGRGNEFFLLIPLGAVLVLVSSQTGFNHHLRYVLPIFPFAFIWMSKVARSVALGHRWVAAMAAVALAASAVSSLWVYPHSLSYFSEAVGGPTQGYRHLASSCVDWGQDLFYLKEWMEKHPEAKPLHLAYEMPLIDPRWVGIESEPVPVGPDSANAGNFKQEELGPLPGWHAVAVNRLHNVEKDWDYLRELRPVGMAGYTIWIYHISVDEANPLRRKARLPVLRAG